MKLGLVIRQIKAFNLFSVPYFLFRPGTVFDVVLQDGVPNTETWVNLGVEVFCGEFPRDRLCGIPFIKVRKEIRVVIVSQTLRK